MSEQLNVKKDYNLSNEEIKLILEACARKIRNSSGKEDVNEGIKVFNHYFNKENPLLDINQPLPGQNQWNALAFTTYFGKTEETKTLLNLGANPSVKLSNNINVLHLAATDGRPYFCTQFLERGVDIDSKSDTNQTAIMRACEAGHLDVVQVLMPYKPNIMLKDSQSLTCLDYGFQNEHYSVVRFLNYYVVQNKVPLKSVGEYTPKKVVKI